MIIRKHAPLAALLLLASGPVLAGAGKGDAEAAIAAAEAARKAAADLHYEWNTIAPLLEEASAALTAGDFDKAVALANKAKYQGDAAVAQARHESEVWKGAVIR
jgi:hypothetical protein